MYRFLLLCCLVIAAALSGCRASGPQRPSTPVATAADSVSTPPPPDSIQARAPWLTPPPAGSSKREVRKWNASRRQAMVEASKPAPAGKVKVKNAGNTSTGKVKSAFTLKQREKLKQYDRSKQKVRVDNRDQTQKNADLSRKKKEKPKTVERSSIPAGFWIVIVVLGAIWLGLKSFRPRL